MKQSASEVSEEWLPPGVAPDFKNMTNPSFA